MGELIGRYGKMVFRTGYRVLNDVHEAEDVAQATFIVLVRNAASLRAECNLPAYLHGVARTCGAEFFAEQDPTQKKGGTEHGFYPVEIPRMKWRDLKKFSIRILTGNSKKTFRHPAPGGPSSLYGRVQRERSCENRRLFHFCYQQSRLRGTCALKRRMSHINPAPRGVPDSPHGRGIKIGSLHHTPFFCQSRRVFQSRQTLAAVVQTHMFWQKE